MNSQQYNFHSPVKYADIYIFLYSVFKKLEEFRNSNAVKIAVSALLQIVATYSF